VGGYQSSSNCDLKFSLELNWKVKGGDCHGKKDSTIFSEGCLSWAYIAKLYERPENDIEPCGNLLLVHNMKSFGIINAATRKTEAHASFIVSFVLRLSMENVIEVVEDAEGVAISSETNCAHDVRFHRLLHSKINSTGKTVRHQTSTANFVREWQSTHRWRCMEMIQSPSSSVCHKLSRRQISTQ
jgi:hypothetical protein